MKHVTNIKLVTDYMNHCPTGALGQAFVIEAITRYAKQTTTHTETVRAQMKDGLIRADAWIRTAEAWLEHLKNNDRIC
jgi:hypothetical protein